jgi:CelD/BcsL family acetyltransferase involved in cellulose biosynthesis
VSDLDLRVVDALDAYAGEWDALVDAAPRPSPFLRSWWLEGVAQPGASYVLALDGAQLVGGLAVVEDRLLGVARARLAGRVALMTYDLDALVHPELDAARADEVVARLAGWISRPGSRFIDIAGLAEDARLTGVLPRRAMVEREDTASWTPIPATFDEYLADLPKNLRQDINRSRRNLAAAGVVTRAVGTDGIDRAISDLRRLHDLRWGAGTTVFSQGYDAFARAARLGVTRGEAVFYEAVIDDRVLASLATFELAGRSWFCQTGRDRDPDFASTGTLVRAAAIERACTRGLDIVDIGPGHRSRKERWARESQAVLRARWGQGIVGRATARSHIAARPVLRRLRGVPKASDEIS